MLPESRDAAYLWDMLDAARTLQRLTSGVSYEQFLIDRGLQLIAERSFEIIGEAARRVSLSFQRAHPEIPWQPIIGQRNIIAHQYQDIEYDKLWEVVAVHLSALIAALAPLIPPPPPDEP